MIKLLSNLPDKILGFSAIGIVTTDDYESILIPIVEEKLTKYGQVRLLYHLGTQFHHFTWAALWDDLKVGVRHWTQWERIGVVTDVGWLRWMTQLLGWLIPSPVKVFHNDQLPQARQWICQ